MALPVRQSFMIGLYRGNRAVCTGTFPSGLNASGVAHSHDVSATSGSGKSYELRSLVSGGARSVVSNHEGNEAVMSRSSRIDPIGTRDSPAPIKEPPTPERRSPPAQPPDRHPRKPPIEEPPSPEDPGRPPKPPIGDPPKSMRHEDYGFRMR